VAGGFEQTVNARRNETIGRVSWSRGDLAGFSFEAGAETAYNTLDSAVELYILGPGGTRTRRDLPIDEATVEEKRAEVYTSIGRNLTPALRVDGGVNYEFSQLKVRGDATADRSLRFLKPNLAIDWKPAAGWHTRLSAKRTVAQLNFYDFLSFAELANDRVNGGNAELLPQRTWEFRATADRTILGSGLIKLDLGYDRVSQLQDQILTDEGFSAPGNIGTGTRRFAAVTLDAPLESLGLSGTRLKLSGQVQRTRVKDPISNQTRGFTGFFPNWNWSAELRRDAGAFSYGIEVEDRAPFTFFRANEIDTSWNGGPFGSAFIEYRPGPRTSATLNVENLFNTEFGRDRFFFKPNRSVEEPYAMELRKRNRHPTIALTLKQSFGPSVGGARGGASD
jgi:outer membrane receptor protein involved in Fe transport